MVGRRSIAKSADQVLAIAASTARPSGRSVERAALPRCKSRRQEGATVFDMRRRDEVLVRHKAAIRAAAQRSRARSIALVGSVARGDDTERSDYDFLVDFEDDADLFDIAGLQVDLEDLLGRTVDVVDSSAMRDSHLAMLEDAIPL